MFAVVGDVREAESVACVQFSVEVGQGVFIHGDVSQRRGVGVVRGGDERIVIGLVHGRYDGDQPRASGAKRREGVSRHRARVDVPGVRRNDRHHLPLQRGEPRSVQIFIDLASQGFRIALIPLTCDR